MQGICPIHGSVKFSLDKKQNVYYCGSCRSAKTKRNRRAELKQKALDYKSGRCCKCGYSRNPNALEFHHIDPAEKDFNISKYALGKSWEKVKEELDKCILLCSNCHREIHSQ